MEQQTKKWWNSKTVWLGVLTTAIGILTFIDSQGAGLSLTMTAVGILNIILRTLSTADKIQ